MMSKKNIYKYPIKKTDQFYDYINYIRKKGQVIQPSFISESKEKCKVAASVVWEL